MWLEQDGTKRRRVGIRWNGCENELGNPRSTGYGTWFLLPENLIAEFVERYAFRRESNPLPKAALSLNAGLQRALKAIQERQA
jgi:hypothetical protein